MPEIVQDEMTGLRHYFILIWKWLWLLVLISTLAAIGAYVGSRFSPKIYQARTRLLINESPNAGINDYTAILMSERQTSTYAEMLTNRPLLQGVIADLDLQMDVKALTTILQITPIKNTRLIAISVEDKDPVQAAAIANSVATQFIKQLETIENSAFMDSRANLEEQMVLMDEQIQAATAELAGLGKKDSSEERDRLETSLAEYRQTYADLLLKLENIRLAEISSNPGVFQLEPAIVPQSPIRPQVLTNTGLAAIIGLLIAAAMVILVETLDDTIRTQEDVNRYLGLPVFGIIPTHQVDSGTPVTISQPSSPVSNAYRTLRSNIHFASVDRPLKKILITSSAPGEGKSTLSVNLGVVMAQGERKTVIIDTDFRRAKAYKYLGLSSRPGLSDILAANPIILQGFLQPVKGLQLEVLASGELPPNPTELLGSDKMARILDLVSENTDMLLVDTPPMLVVADAAIIAAHVDGVLLVIKPGITRLTAAKQIIEQLRMAKANLLGVVLNDVNVRRDGHYNSYYHAYEEYYEDKAKTGLFGRWRKSKAK
jgi:capsular exopolysaccharide synthesis family protein